MPLPHDAAHPCILLMVGRDDWQRDGPLNIALLDRLQRPGVRVVWEDPATRVAHAWLRWIRHWPGMPAALQLWGRRLLLLGCAAVWPRYALYLLRRRGSSIEARCSSLQRTVRSLARQGEVLILSRSSGGRVASRVADTLPLRHIVCLGYPFQPPHQGDEPARYQHLATLRTPMLIIQGRHDVYGGAEVPTRYALSPQIALRIVETDHDFRLSPAQADHIVGLIEDALGWR